MIHYCGFQTNCRNFAFGLVSHIQQDISFFISFVGSVNHIAYKLLSYRPPASTFVLQQAFLTFGVVGATTAKLVLHADNIKFSLQNEEGISILIIMCIIFPVCFSMSCLIKNILIIIGKLYTKSISYPSLWCCCFLHMYTKLISDVM